MSNRAFRVTVCFESRPEGGLRAYSDDVPGLVLSSPDVDGVLEDVPVALSVILSEQWNSEVQVIPLQPNIRDALENNGILPPKGFVPGPKEYVALRQ